MSKKQKLSKLLTAGLIAFILWLISFGYSISILLSYKDKLPEIQKAILLGDIPTSMFILIGNFILGSLFFTIGTFCASVFITKKKKFQGSLAKKLFRYSLRFIVVLIFFPFYSLYYLVKQIKISRKITLAFPIISVVFVLLIFIPIWLANYVFAGAVAVYTGRSIVGYQQVWGGVSGTGSMYPTFPKGKGKTDKELASETVAQLWFLKYPGGINLFGKKYFNHTLTRGDIINFTNKTTLAITKKQYNIGTGFIKRVIGLPGDTLELRNGIVYLNRKPLKEPYTASAHATFGEDFLHECTQITIPQNKVFVMGDNRKESEDSRDIGFVYLKDIQSYLSLADQKGNWDKHWRNTANDLSDTTKIRVDKTKYLALLNKKRKEADVPPLKYEPKLEETAEKRGEVMLKYDDFSYTATRSGYTMDSAMNEVGYFDPVTGESESQGYFTADELINNQFEFPDSKKFVLDKQFQDVGISEVEGEINGCPTQVIVQHFAGYVPPNYSKETIDSWQRAVSNLRDIQPGWAGVKNNTDFYNQHRADVDRINDLISQRLSNDTEIVTKMQANQWLTGAENKIEDQDETLANEINSLADRLNNSH